MPATTMAMDEKTLLEHITVAPKLFSSRPIIQDQTITVEELRPTMMAGASLEKLSKAKPRVCFGLFGLFPPINGCHTAKRYGFNDWVNVVS